MVSQVGLDGEELAQERQCDPSEVFINWGDVMKRLDARILLM